jgi:hypothetical protein
LSGGAQEEIKRIIEPARWEVIDAFEFIGAPIKPASGDDLHVLKWGEEKMP